MMWTRGMKLFVRSMVRYCALMVVDQIEYPMRNSAWARKISNAARRSIAFAFAEDVVKEAQREQRIDHDGSIREMNNARNAWKG